MRSKVGLRWHLRHGYVHKDTRAANGLLIYHGQTCKGSQVVISFAIYTACLSSASKSAAKQRHAFVAFQRLFWGNSQKGWVRLPCCNAPLSLGNEILALIDGHLLRTSIHSIHWYPVVLSVPCFMLYQSEATYVALTELNQQFVADIAAVELHTTSANELLC